MSEAVGVVVAHGNLAAGLVEAAEHISGIGGALSAISNRGLSPEVLREQLAAAVFSLKLTGAGAGEMDSSSAQV